MSEKAIIEVQGAGFFGLFKSDPEKKEVELNHEGVGNIQIGKYSSLGAGGYYNVSLNVARSEDGVSSELRIKALQRWSRWDEKGPKEVEREHLGTDKATIKYDGKTYKLVGYLNNEKA